MFRIAIVAALSLGVVSAHADCMKIDDKLKKEMGDNWRPATERERVFLSGVFVLNPLTHSGLPVGDKVFIVTGNGDKSMVVWADQSAALSCDMMPGAPALLKLLAEFVSGHGDDDL